LESGQCGGSTPAYYAWYTFSGILPPKFISSITVSPGDLISATVVYNGSQFTLKLSNHTVGKAVAIKKTLSTPRTSAEWIAEAVNDSFYPLPLADFTRVSFGDDYTGVSDTNWATDSTISGPISDFGTHVQKITMADGTIIKAKPSALTTDGSSFKVTWKHE
jgi:Peptidase A4 family